MTSEPLLVGIDIGTTNIKAIVFDRRGRIAAEASATTPTHIPRPGWAFYRPDELWECTAAALRRAVAGVDEPRRIEGVAVASIGETGFPIDAQGAAVYDGIAWYDKRTEPQARLLSESVGHARLFASSGLSLQPIFGLCKILWLRDNEPEVYGRAVRWLNTADYIAFRLCGVAATDYSLASRTLALDLRARRWDEALLAEVGVKPGLMAPLVQSGAALGPVLAGVAAQTGLPPTALVAAGGHDHVCGALAVDVVEPGAVLNSVGTAEALFVAVDEPLADPEMGVQGYTQGAHVTGGYYALGGLYTSGACAAWFAQASGGADLAALTAEAEQAPPGSMGVLFLPTLRLANPPYDDPLARGAFAGLSTDVTRGALFRAVLEGLEYEMRSSLEPLLRHAGVQQVRRFVAIGGGTRSRLRTQIKASVLNRPVQVAGVDEATALGAALLGGLAAGVYHNTADALAQLEYSVAETAPDPAQAALYEEVYQQSYRRLYPALRDLHHAIEARGSRQTDG